MNQSPEELTCLAGQAALNLNWIPLTTSTCLLSFEMVKPPERTWLRSTMATVIAFDHSELGNWGTKGEVRIDDVTNLRPFTYILRSSSTSWRPPESPRPKMPPWITQGKSCCSAFCLLTPSRATPGEKPCLDPAVALSAVLNPVPWFQAALRDLRCCLMILR